MATSGDPKAGEGKDKPPVLEHDNHCLCKKCLDDAEEVTRSIVSISKEIIKSVKERG